jgi:hypothetical protein
MNFRDCPVCHAVVVGVKQQVFEAEAFVHKDMADAHQVETSHIVRAVFDLFGQYLYLDFWYHAKLVVRENETAS